MLYILILNIYQSSSDYGDYDDDDDYDVIMMMMVVVLKIVVLLVTMMTLVKVRCSPDREVIQDPPTAQTCGPTGGSYEILACTILPQLIGGGLRNSCLYNLILPSLEFKSLWANLIQFNAMIKCLTSRSPRAAVNILRCGITCF